MVDKYFHLFNHNIQTGTLVHTHILFSPLLWGDSQRWQQQTNAAKGIWPGGSSTSNFLNDPLGLIPLRFCAFWSDLMTQEEFNVLYMLQVERWCAFSAVYTEPLRTPNTWTQGSQYHTKFSFSILIGHEREILRCQRGQCNSSRN